MNPSDSRFALLRFRLLIRNSRWPPHPTKRVSSTGQCVFLNMPSLLPRESTRATSVRTARARRPSPFDHRVGFSNSFTRLLMSSLALRPAHLLFGNSRPQITPVPLPHATKAYGQLLGRDFNPLDTPLLLRTVRSSIVALRLSLRRIRYPFRGPACANDPPNRRKVHPKMLRNLLIAITAASVRGDYGSSRKCAARDGAAVSTSMRRFPFE